MENEQKHKSHSGIQRRWLTNIVSWLVALVLLSVVVTFLTVHSYYYSNMRSGMEAKALKDEGKVEEAKAYMAEKQKEYEDLFANPYQAAKYGYIDDVIEPRNTRFRIIRALAQLENKKLTNPAKKHGNIPL